MKMELINNFPKSIELMQQTAAWMEYQNLIIPESWQVSKMSKENIISGFNANPEDFFVFYIDNKPAAALILQTSDKLNWVDWPSKKNAIYLYKFCASNEYRGKKVSDLFIPFLKEYAKEIGTPVIRLDTDFRQKGLRKMYESHGFINCKNVMDDNESYSLYEYDPNLNIKFENFKLTDIKTLSNFIGAQWDLGKKSSGLKKLPNLIYSLELIVSSTELVSISVDGKIAGFAGLVKYGSKKLIIKRFLAKIISKFLVGIQNKSVRKAIKQYYSFYDYCPKNLKEKFDGEITILILNKNSRSLGVGSILFTHILNQAAKNKIKTVRIDTDASCKVDFYTKNGCVKYFETLVGDYMEPSFVFGKKLDYMP